MTDLVHSPSHYNRGGFELADVIDAFELGRWEAQAAQYLFRAQFKDDGAHELQDLEKAAWFLARRIAQLRSTPAPDAPKDPRLGPATLERLSDVDRNIVEIVLGDPAQWDFADALAELARRGHGLLGQRLIDAAYPLKRSGA